MPLPKPGDHEDRADFMARCMGDETMNADFPDTKQRAAVCNQQWRDRNKTMMQTKAYSIIDIQKTVETATERVIEGIASTPTPDRVRDVVEPMGAKFKLPMPLLWQHRSDEPVGTVEFAQPTKDGIPFKARIATISEPGELKNLVDKAWQSVKAKLVRGVSIGFKILDHEIMKSGGWRIKEWEWLELSLVTIPANAEATIQTIKSFDARSLAAIGRKRSAASSFPGATGQHSKGDFMQSLAERIAATSEDVKALAERMNTLMEKEDAEGSLDKAEADEIAEIERDIKTANEKLRRLKSLQAASESAIPVEAETPARSRGNVRTVEIRTVPAQPKPYEEKGVGWAAMVKCQTLPHLSGKYFGMRPEIVAKHMYPGYTDLHMALKADVAGGTTTDNAWAEPLVTPNVLASEFIEYLRARTIVGRFGTDGIPSLRRIPFNVKIQEQTAAGDGYWVGEGAAKPLTSYEFTSTTHRWCKVANIAVLSEDLIRFSNPAADVLVRNLLAESLQAKLDTEFITASTAKVPDVSPGSVLNGSANTSASTAVTAAQVLEDIKTLVGYFTAANNPLDSGVFIMRQTAATALSLMVNSVTGVRDFPTMTTTGGTLAGFPVIVSQYVPTGIVALVNASDIYLSDDGGVSVAMSREASLEMSTTPGASISDGSPGAPVAQTQKVVSMFQTNSVAIRCERMINWSLRRLSAVAYLTSVGWGNTASSPDGAPI